MPTGLAGRYLGGLLGSGNASTTLSDTYATSPVTGSVALGGLVGNGDVAITNSYAQGTITTTAGTLPGSPSDSGGLIGLGTPNVTASFWNIDTAGRRRPWRASARPVLR
jgi:hypothetical protein